MSEKAFTDIVFDSPLSQGGRFVEVEDATGQSVSVGEWLPRTDGYWVLRLPASPQQIAAVPEMLEALEVAKCFMGGSKTVLTRKEHDQLVEMFREAIAKAKGDA